MLSLFSIKGCFQFGRYIPTVSNLFISFLSIHVIRCAQVRISEPSLLAYIVFNTPFVSLKVQLITEKSDFCLYSHLLFENRQIDFLNLKSNGIENIK